jgi:hypothetical protein
LAGIFQGYYDISLDTTAADGDEPGYGGTSSTAARREFLAQVRGVQRK